MRILVDKDLDRVEWDAIVQSAESGTWFQTPSAFDFFQSQPEQFLPFAYGLENDGKLRAVCAGYITQERSKLKQFLTRRAIIIGGPALADDCTDAEVAALMSAVRKELRFKAIYVECRNFNSYERWKDAFASGGFYYIPHLNFHVDCTNKEAMDAALSENRKRQIKKAIKSGVEIVEAQSEQEIADWFIILQNLYYTKVKTPLFSLSFFLEFYRQKRGKYLLVKYENKVIGGIMCPIMEGRCIYEWFVCGNDTEYKNQNPSVMATYAAMEYGHTHGLGRFDFMGAGKPNEPYGVRDFKARFGGNEVENGRFLAITKPILYKIGVWGVKLLKRIK